MIERPSFAKLISDYLSVFPICAIVGPRQCGKTTLALEYAASVSSYLHFDMEDPFHHERMAQPHLALADTQKLIVIDEIQRCPDLFPYLRVHVDRYPSCKILILGSVASDLVRQGAESLAGRIGYIELTPFNLQEVEGDTAKLWKRGGFPRSFMARSNNQSRLWIKQYISTFLEKDVAALGFNVSPSDMRKVWMMAAHYHGNLVNYSEIGRSLMISDMTVRRYLSILESSFMVRLLPPWHANVGKRQVKNPKLYVRDSGIWHNLMGIEDSELVLHPKVGASFEGFALEETIRFYGFDKEDCYFWRTHDGAELDLLVCHKGKKLGFEFKYGRVGKMTPSMKIAMQDLQLDHLTVVTLEDDEYRLDEKVSVLGLHRMLMKR